MMNTTEVIILGKNERQRMSARNSQIIKAIDAVTSLILMETGRNNAKKSSSQSDNERVKAEIGKIDEHIAKLRKIRNDLEEMTDHSVG